MADLKTTPTEADNRGAFMILCGVGLFAILSTTMSKSPVLPLFAKDYLHVGDSVLGLIAAASTVVGIIVSLPAGALSDILGRRTVLLSAMFVFASAPILYLFVHSAEALVAVRLYHGLATAIFGPVAMAYVADLATQRRAERMGWYSSATLVGRSVAPMLGGGLLTYYALGGEHTLLSYHAVYIGCGIAGLLALVGALYLPKAQRSSSPSPEAICAVPSLRSCVRQIVDGLKVVGRNRIILTTSLTEAVQYLAFGAVETFLPLYAKSKGVTAWQIGIIFGAQIITLALTKPLSGRESDRLGRRAVIGAGLGLNAVALVALTVYPTFWGFLVGATLFGLAMSVVTASTSALVADVSRARHYGTSLGVLSTIMDVGHASGPIVAGLLIPLLAYANTYRLFALLMLAAIPGFLAMTTSLHQQMQAEESDALS
ncbi:MAG: MFS transporter [Armatimonadia bacterium]